MKPVLSTDEYQSPGYFSLDIAADRDRKEYNIRNHSLIRENIRPDFLFIGDSITRFWELDAYFHKEECRCINRGIAGDTTTYLNKRYDFDALQLNPGVIILHIGINDTMDLEGDYWKLVPPLPFDEVLGRAKENISDMAMRTKAAGITLAIGSLLPMKIVLSLHVETRQRFIRDLNTWLSEFCAAEGFIYADYFGSIVDADGDLPKEGTMYDGLHPDAGGYRIMSDVLSAALAKRDIRIS